MTGIAVKYECPNCKSSLRSALKLAGKNDVCPDCQASFVVPGTKELHEYKAQQSEKLRQKEQAIEEKRLEGERQKQEQTAQKRVELASRREQEKLAIPPNRDTPESFVQSCDFFVFIIRVVWRLGLFIALIGSSGSFAFEFAQYPVVTIIIGIAAIWGIGLTTGLLLCELQVLAIRFMRHVVELLNR